MYRHFLVPIDSTDASIEVVGNAVGLARAVGARITFHASTDDAGKCGELLAKAEAAARAFGVPCDSKHMPSTHAATVIVETARGIGCDLIFMASQGHAQHDRHEPGMRLSSETIDGVLSAGLPVLVSGAGTQGPSSHAIGIIRDEHRSLAAVLHAWMRALAAARSAGRAADPELMRAIVRYVECFALALHDPTEEEHLFSRLRERTSALDAELDELQRQHARDRLRVAELARRVDALAAASSEAAVDATRELDDAVRSYAALVWEHLGREEGVVLPAAQRYLTAADWSDIDDAFVKNREPRMGDEAGVAQLFSRIVTALQVRG